MAISISNYVDITSSVGGASIVPTRDLIGRLFTTNSLLPPQTLIEFSTATEVGSYFGTNSEEYLRAIAYFAWVSKNQTQPKNIQFARWVKAATAPMIYPVPANATTLAAWTSIANGSFILTMGGFTFSMSALSFTGAASLAAVATIIQTAIRSNTGGGAVWTTATVTYSSSSAGFLLVGGATDVVTNPIVVSALGTGTDITPKGLLGWVPQQTVTSNGTYIPGAIWARGSAAETVTETLTSSANASDNFGSFLFLNNIGITLADVTAAATWNNTQNAKFMFVQAVTAANVGTWTTALSSIGGVGLTLSGLTTTQVGTITNTSATIINLQDTSSFVVGQPVSGANIPAGSTIVSIPSSTSVIISASATATVNQNIVFSLVQYPEQIPMMIFSATDYADFNSVQNYMYQQFPGITASVSDDSTAAAYDSLSVNYYGVTQSAGQLVSFYQRGFLQGLGTDILDMGAYANEVWLQAEATTDLINLQLALSQLPANSQGRIILLNTLQGVINKALNNGTISVGKTLNQTQINYITAQTGNSNAWYQVQNSGYWMDVVIALDTGSGEYIATYTLIYSKNDVVRKIIGTHTLI